jgi:hypothetical protein
VNYGANPATSVGVAARAFRSVRPSIIHRIAEEMRAGVTLSTSTRGAAARIFDMIASADDAIGEEQRALADLLRVHDASPDQHDGASAEADAARLAAYAALLERRERELRGERA